MTELDLNKICDGHLQREFARLLPGVLTAANKTGKKATVTLKITVDPINGEPGIPPAFCFTAVVRCSLPSSRKDERYSLLDGKLSNSDGTMSLPFDDKEGILK